MQRDGLAPIGVLLAIERDHALAQQRQSLKRLVPALAARFDRLVKVGVRRGVITSLGRVPPKLPHQDGGFCLDLAKLAADCLVAGMSGQEPARARGPHRSIAAARGMPSD